MTIDRDPRRGSHPPRRHGGRRCRRASGSTSPRRAPRLRVAPGPQDVLLQGAQHSVAVGGESASGRSLKGLVSLWCGAATSSTRARASSRSRRGRPRRPRWARAGRRAARRGHAARRTAGPGPVRRPRSSRPHAATRGSGRRRRSGSGHAAGPAARCTRAGRPGCPARRWSCATGHGWCRGASPGSSSARGGGSRAAGRGVRRARTPRRPAAPPGCARSPPRAWPGRASPRASRTVARRAPPRTSSCSRSGCAGS